MSLTEADRAKAAVKPWCKRSTDMTNLFKSFIKNESGATAIEYGLIASLVAVAAIGAMTTVGTKLTSTFTEISDKLK